MESNKMLLQTLESQDMVHKFMLNRGGNRGLTFDAWEGFGNVMVPNTTGAATPSPTPRNTVLPVSSNPKFASDDQFYDGDKILSGDYFKGWNDTYFFQSNAFRNNSDFWTSPFRAPMSK